MNFQSIKLQSNEQVQRHFQLTVEEASIGLGIGLGDAIVKIEWKCKPTQHVFRN